MDFITSSSYFFPDELILIPKERVECKVAELSLAHFTPVEGFGSSDCSCPSHLFKVGLKEEFFYFKLRLSELWSVKILKTCELERIWSSRKP